MKSVVLPLILLLSSLNLQAQYTPIEAENLNLENYSSREIRNYLLHTEIKDSDIYLLARSSRRSKTWSIVDYSIAGVLLLGGIAAIVEYNQYKPEDSDGFHDAINHASTPLRAGINFALGGVGVLLGYQAGRRSKRELKEAIALYQLKSN
ncbi:hypothetical protein [Croceimicrobium hydrocarbonivorans]|uniref:Uncharacterized protein n=1 Tax=Croceimicrobium hydrocarbonivorans TaxID=2761580 RepID=A0A7H0VFV0_9FLAO|nr:hypothetical protein [Croceimicrobium hydrocarbonivorans]QNR24598.1 hypothetical protein H4K34_01785 [Croceimicrobium hydrocarbonivorans]